MRMEILQEAEAELVAAIAYYNEIEPGLGLRLKDEVRQMLRWVCENPAVPAPRPTGYRRVNLRVFPYYVVYFIWLDVIWVLALAHGRRSPEYWSERKGQIG